MATQQNRKDTLNTIKNNANFQFKDELIALINQPCIIETTGLRVLTNSKYKRILHPLYTWITKTKTVHPEVLNSMQIGILETNDVLVVAIYNIHTNIYLPKSLQNIVIRGNMPTPSCKIVLQNPNSLYFGDIRLYDIYMKCCIDEIISPNIELCKILEEKILKQLLKFKNISDKMISGKVGFNASKLYRLYEPLNINRLNYLVGYHYKKLHQPYNNYSLNDDIHVWIMDELIGGTSKFDWELDKGKIDTLCNNLSSSIQYLATIK